MSPTGWDASSQYNPHSIDTELSWILTETMFNRITSIKFFAPRLRQRTYQTLAKPRCKELLTADSRRFAQIRIRTFHRRDAEYAEGRIIAQSGDDDWAKAYNSNLSNVFVCRRLPTNKKLILCALCVSAVNKFFSARIGENRRLIAVTLCMIGSLLGGRFGKIQPWRTA